MEWRDFLPMWSLKSCEVIHGLGVRPVLRKGEARQVLVMPLVSLPHVLVILHVLGHDWATEGLNVGLPPSAAILGILYSVGKHLSRTCNVSETVPQAGPQPE